MKTKVTVGTSFLMAAGLGAGCSRKSDPPATPAVVVGEAADGSIITVPHPEQFPLVSGLFTMGFGDSMRNKALNAQQTKGRLGREVIA